MREQIGPPDAVRPFFEQHCVKCHSGESPEGDLTLAPLLKGEEDVALWDKVLEKIETGQMPPKTGPQPAMDDKRGAADWLMAQLSAVKSARRDNEGRVVLRRLSRLEYENTLRDLLETDVHVQHLLPQDAAAGGFDNVGEGAAYIVVPAGAIFGSGGGGARSSHR